MNQNVVRFVTMMTMDLVHFDDKYLSKKYQNIYSLVYRYLFEIEKRHRVPRIFFSRSPLIYVQIRSID